MSTNAHHTILARALPIAFGGLAGMNSQIKPEGIYLGFRIGMGAQSLGPSYLKGWVTSNRAYHLGFLGITGGGKSVSMMAMLARERAINGVPICLIEPMGNAPRLAKLLEDDPGMRLHRLTWQSIQINPLDWVGENEAEQTEHMIALLQTMLNRSMDNIEKGLVVSAVRQVYAGLTEEEREDPECTPRLEMLCEALADHPKPEAHFIADELDGLYVSGGYASIFNRHTNLDLAFDGATLFDAQDVAGQDSTNENFKTILYFTLMSSLVRTARRDKQRGQARPRIFALDEYYALARNVHLKQRMDVLIKTARNLKMGVWFAEQNLATFTGVSMNEVGGGGLVGGSGYFLLTNVDRWFVFRQGEAEAALLRREFGSRCPEGFARFLPQARTGQCVAILDRPNLLEFNLLPREVNALTR